MSASSDSAAPARGLRTLVINATFSTFLAIVVFVVGTGFFVIPRELEQHRRLATLDARVAGLEARLAALDEKVADQAGALATLAHPSAPTTTALAPAPSTSAPVEAQ